MKAVTTKEWKRKKRYLMFNFPLTKKVATTQDRQILRNSDEKQDCQFWILSLVVFIRFPANRDCLLKLYMLLKSARTVSCELRWGKRVYIGLTSWLTEGVVTILCFYANLSSCCLPSAYHRRRPTVRHFTEGDGKIALKITICSKNKQFALMPGN